jgi:hypothetical protein
MGAAAATPNFNYGFPTPGPQHPTGDKVMDHVFFLSNTGWKLIREDEQFDYIVIGSGICGYAFAERVLRTQPRANILIIEQGRSFLMSTSRTSPCHTSRRWAGCRRRSRGRCRRELPSSPRATSAFSTGWSRL